MATINIVKGVPLPAGAKRALKGMTSRGRKPKYPFADLRVGESFFVPNAKIRNISSLAHTSGLTYGKQLLCRTEGTGVRCWCFGYVKR